MAHIDAGKTTLSERILFSAGEILHPGDVDDGLATLDYLPEEKERGITIEAGVAHFRWKNYWFNFIDTPGHVDFSSEVDMAMDIVSGVILVISATAGVETQTMAVWQKLRSRRIPVLIFINKLDHPHSDLDQTLISIEEHLRVRPLLMSEPWQDVAFPAAMLDVLTQKMIYQDSQGREKSVAEPSAQALARASFWRADLCEAASLVDDRVLEDHLCGKRVEEASLIAALKKLMREKDYVLCYGGSALLNRGVRQLLTGASLFFDPVQTFFPEWVLGRVIRVRSCRQSGEFALVQSARDLPRDQWPQGIAFYRIMADLLESVDYVRAGDIYAMTYDGLELSLGDQVDLRGNVRRASGVEGNYQPLLQTQIECLQAKDWERVDRALKTLSRMDPSCQVRTNTENGSWLLLTVGEVQREVLLSRLQREFGCAVRAAQPEVRYVERLKIVSVECENALIAGPHRARFVFLVEKTETPGFALENAELCPSGEIAASVRSAAEDFVRDGVAGKGELDGLRICLLKCECSEGIPLGLVKKAAADAFRLGVRRDHIEVFEPIMSIEVVSPPEYAGNLLGDLQSRGAQIENLGGDTHFTKIYARIPLKNIFGYSTIGRSISKGTASYALRFYGYRKVQM